MNNLLNIERISEKPLTTRVHRGIIYIVEYAYDKAERISDESQ